MAAAAAVKQAQRPGQPEADRALLQQPRQDVEPPEEPSRQQGPPLVPKDQRPQQHSRKMASVPNSQDELSPDQADDRV